ncbi:hypothetical protein LJC10_01355 [Selenomonadales bacterium OttesenSCG-928-I06]|nr:hypothetical protein [Selenomonadales bacterium OttesenSCG-928-I06]
MKCQLCGKPIENGETCDSCFNEGSVRVLTRTERDFYEGETIDASNDSEKQNYYNYSNQNNNMFFKVRSFNLVPKSFLGKLTLILIIGLLILISIPLVLLIFLLGAISWFFFKRKY